MSRYLEAGRECVLVGHAGHPEVEGTLGQTGSGGMHLVESIEDVAALDVADPERLGFVTQTTLSMDDTAAIVEALRARFPAIRGPKKSDICYATQNRQDAVKRIAPRCDVFIVAGSRNSSNSNRLRDIAESHGMSAHLVDRVEDLDRRWLEGAGRVGVTAGASAPEKLVQEIVAALERWGRRGGGGGRSAPRGDRVLAAAGASFRLSRGASGRCLARGRPVPRGAANRLVGRRAPKIHGPGTRTRPESKHGPGAWEVSGAGEWIRTTDLLITNQLLCRLSYTGRRAFIIRSRRRRIDPETVTGRRAAHPSALRGRQAHFPSAVSPEPGGGWGSFPDRRRRRVRITGASRGGSPPRGSPFVAT